MWEVQENIKGILEVNEEKGWISVKKLVFKWDCRWFISYGFELHFVDIIKGVWSCCYHPEELVAKKEFDVFKKDS